MPAHAESIGGRLTRKDDANAVRAFGRAWTIHDLIDHRDQAPGRFDRNNQRLGLALGLGLDGLHERRALNPRRFDFYHPVLGYLLWDTGPGQGLGTAGEPILPILDLGPVDDVGFTGGGLESPLSPPPSPPLDGPLEPPPEVLPPPLPERPDPPPGPGEGAQPQQPEGPGTSAQPESPRDLDPHVIPEPAAVVQLLVGLTGLGGLMAWRGRFGGVRAPA